MIRRDYVLRMIEEFIRALSRMQALKKDRRWDELDDAIDDELKKLIGSDASAVARYSETELLALLVQGESTSSLRERTLILTTLLYEAGDAATGQGRTGEGRIFYLKSMHLLLDILNRGEVFEYPEFVPKISAMASVLENEPLPPQTLAMLMQHYERIGNFAKAEDTLFALLDSDPGNPAIIEFGIAFYHRILNESNDLLESGNLPRSEAEDGLRELERRRTLVQS